MDFNKLSKQYWGPRFWTLLHTLAECSGSQVNTILASDEAESWIMLLKSQQFVMPCPICKKHYGDWMRTHNVDRIRQIQTAYRKEWLQTWLWELHEHVKMSNTIISEFTKEMILERYPRKRVDSEVKDINEVFKLAFERHSLKPEDIHRWKTGLQRLRALYGV